MKQLKKLNNSNHFFEYKEMIYPNFQKNGHASQFAIPFAKHFLYDQDLVIDIGCSKKEWSYPGSLCIDDDKDYNSNHLPTKIKLSENGYSIKNNYNSSDYIINLEDKNRSIGIFSSHMLEHVPNWSDTLCYWINYIKEFSNNSRGIIFLYLPDYSQKYWRMWNNKKHKTTITPEIIFDYLSELQDDNKINYAHISGVDLNNSFCVIIDI